MTTRTDVRAGRTDFAQRVRTAQPSPISMPLTHVTDAYSFRAIMEDEALIPSHCSIFGENLVYLFYGRPAYRSVAERESSAIDAYWPICFVMKPEVVAPKRIFPFDSGAFHHRLFDSVMYHRMIKEDFALDADPGTPGKLLRLFWQDEKAYFNAHGAADFTPENFEFEAKAYLSLISDAGRAPFDDRCSAIEIQTDAAVALEGNTIAVITPTEFITPSLSERIEKMGAVILPYNVTRRQRPGEMVGLICDIVRDLLGGGRDGRVKCW